MSEPVMTETTRALARKVSEYRAVLKGLGVDTAELEYSGDRSGCPAYFGDGVCRSGCWEEPLCQTGEPSDGWPLAKLRWGLRLVAEQEEAQRARAADPDDLGWHVKNALRTAERLGQPIALDAVQIRALLGVGDEHV